MDRFWNPATLDEALAILAAERDAVMPIAGGTDLMMRLRQGRYAPRALVSVRHLRGLTDGPVQLTPPDEARGGGTTLVLDALAPLADVIASPLARAHAPELVKALLTIGSPAIRNVATLAGNLANASPAADSLPPLLVLDAQVVLARTGGTRQVPLATFLTGPGKTTRAPDELLLAVRVPLPSVTGRRVAVFTKFGKRRANIIASANVAARLHILEGRLGLARLAAGGVAATPRRLGAIEVALHGQPATADLFARVEAVVLATIDELIQPLSDVRGSALFKRALVLHAVEGICARVARVAAGEEAGDDA